MSVHTCSQHGKLVAKRLRGTAHCIGHLAARHACSSAHSIKRPRGPAAGLQHCTLHVAQRGCSTALRASSELFTMSPVSFDTQEACLAHQISCQMQNKQLTCELARHPKV